jgi:hypothetical protein
MSTTPTVAFDFDDAPGSFGYEGARLAPSSSPSHGKGERCLLWACTERSARPGAEA